LPESTNWFREQVEERLSQGKNLLVLVTGELGIGKSWWALKIAEAMDPKFTIDKVVFLPEDFMHQVQTCPERSWVVFDEPNIAFSHRNWHSRVNKMMAAFIQSSRFLKVNVLFALPTVTFLDSAARRICHLQVVVGDRGKGIVYRIRPNLFNRTPEIRTYKIGTVLTGPPAPWLVTAYEAKRAAFHAEYFKPGSLEEHDGHEAKFPSVEELVAKVKEDPALYQVHQRYSASKIRSVLKIPERLAYDVRWSLQNENHSQS